MSEKEKMLNGEYYNPQDSELVNMRCKARILFEQYNKTSIVELEKRQSILNKLIGKMGSNIYIEPDFKCDYGVNIELGNDVYMNFNCILLDVCRIKIGNNVMFAPEVQVLTASHPIDANVRNKGLEYAMPIVIGDNCWIGARSTILPGVTIGENVTIGAGSVVTKNIPANSLAFGNPCKVVKHI